MSVTIQMPFVPYSFEPGVKLSDILDKIARDRDCVRVNVSLSEFEKAGRLRDFTRLETLIRPYA